MQIKAIRGVKDILPEDAETWRLIEEKAKGACQTYGYRRLRTPILEEAGLFRRSIGSSSDIVRKEMYSFLDHKKRVICLRPEGTASVVRAYLEHGFDKNIGLAKFYYFGPMFRAERPQAGRLRQFHHLGAEAIGSASAYLDAEVVSLAVRILTKIGVRNFTLQLNSIGCLKDRKKYQAILKEAVKNKLGSLCVDCRSRYKVNLMRIFDCKQPSCRRIIRHLPSIAESALLCPECAEHFSRVQLALTSLNIRFVLSPELVRGLDYYTKTCFEIVHPDLGAQNALGAGGRYDDLVSNLGGPQRPAVGFALGLERIIAALGASGLKSCPGPSASIYLATIGEESKKEAFKLLQNLRNQGIASEIDYQDRSLKGQMRQADKLGVKYVAILGEDELKKNMIIIRNMQSKQQKEVAIDKLVDELKELQQCSAPIPAEN